VLVRQAIDMLADSRVGDLGPTTWADLGCGDGTFTRALAHLLASGSMIHAVDRDAAALRRIPITHDGVSITTHHADFTRSAWPFETVDGLLMANSLHYVRDQAAFIRACASRMRAPHRFLIVEYDTKAANTWVPYPVSRSRLSTIFDVLGDVAIEDLGSRPSVYRRASLYAALITSRTPLGQSA
jgi:trans-aconitate methyltransferase